MTEIILWKSMGTALTASFVTKWAPLTESGTVLRKF